MAKLDDVAKVAQDNDVLSSIELEGDVVTKDCDSIQHAGNVQLNTVTTKLPSFGTILERIFAEGTDYTKKCVDTRLAFVEKLLGAESLDTVIQVQSEYAKTSYADFVVQGTKMGELYSNLAKACFKPIEHVRKQVETLAEQTKQLPALAQKVTLAIAIAEPLKTGVAEAFNHAA
ncbi:MAG: phasin family protein [Methylocella sp.]